MVGPLAMPYARDTILAGKLRVVRLLGEGGLGEVYEVEHQLTKHRRALKVLKPQWRTDSELVERFLREASAAGHIGNPHIVEAFDAGMLDDGSPYLLMEMLEGQTLDVVLRWNGRLDAGVAVQLLLQVCDAISAAHEAGIVHRDLKPENLFLLKREGHSFVKVLDFGISKFDSGLTGRAKVTNTNTALGTPLYMAPEQMRASRDVDERADLYSLGVILYECIAGAPPYDADNFAELAAMVLGGGAKPLDEAMPGTTKQLARIVAQAMAVDRTQRFPSAAAFAEALEPFATSGVTSLTELPAKARVPPARAERQPTVSPWGATAKPDDETQSGAAARPTEDATPVAVRREHSTVITRRWPLLVGATVLAVAAGFVGVRAVTDQQPPVTPIAEPVVDAGPLAVVATPLPPVPPEPERLGTEVDAGVTMTTTPTLDAGLVRPSARPEGKKREVVEGYLQFTCPDANSEPCIVRWLESSLSLEAPFVRVRVPSGRIVASTPTGTTKPFNLVFSKPGETKKLEASLQQGLIRPRP